MVTSLEDECGGEQGVRKGTPCSPPHDGRNWLVERDSRVKSALTTLSLDTNGDKVCLHLDIHSIDDL